MNKKLRNGLTVTASMAMAMGVGIPVSTVLAAPVAPTAPTVAPASTYDITYQGHVQNKGWMPAVSTNGEQSDITLASEVGTNGLGLRMEALKLSGINLPAGASIVYQAHVQNKGWMSAVQDGVEAGTNGLGLRMEAFKITLQGLPGYAVEYQAHVQNKGWMPAVSTENGTDISAASEAGTNGLGLRMEALRIEIVKTATEKLAEVTAMDAVTQAQGTKTVSDVAAATTAINLVQDTTEKASLTVLNAAIDTTLAVSSVSPITVQAVTVGTVATLPTTTNVTLANGTVHTALITWDAASQAAATYATVGTVTVNGTLADYGNYAVSSSVTVNPVQTALAVSSVSAVDANHIVVTFNNKVLADGTANAANTKANYKLSNSPLNAGDTVAVSADGMTATITLASALTNDTAYTVAVLKNLSDINAVALSPTTDYTTGIFLAAHTAPTVTSLVGQPNGDILITFNERVADVGAAAAITINGQNAVPNAPVDNTVTVPKASLIAANITSGNSYSAVVSGYNDLSANPMSLYNSTFAYNVVADTTAPAVTSLVSKDEKTLTLTFSKELNGANKDGLTDNTGILGLGVTKGAALTPIGTVATTTTDGKVFTVNLTPLANILYDGNATPVETSAALAVTVNGYKDLSLNVGQKFTQNITVTKDTTLPTLTKSAYDATNSNFVFTFSKALTAETALQLGTEGITVVDSNGVAQTALAAKDFNPIAAGDKTLTINNGALGYNLPAGAYTFNFAKGTVSDTALNGGNQIAQFSTTATVAGAADTTAPKITLVTSLSKDHMAVTFDSQVKGGAIVGSATDTSNYKLNGLALPVGTSITLNTDKTVATIVMPTGSVSTSQTYVLTTSNVQDLAGNVLVPTDMTVLLTDSVAPVLKSATYDATSGTMILTFSEDVNGKSDESAVTGAKQAVAADFVVKDNGVTDVTNKLVIGNGTTENQIKISSSDMNFSTGTISITTAHSGIIGADAAGNTLAPDTTVLGN